MVARAELQTRLAGTEAEPTVATSSGFFCTVSPDDIFIGACKRSLEACTRSQQKLIEAGNDVGPCVQAAAAFCFAKEAAGKRTLGCAPSFKSCDRQLERARAEYLDAGFSNCVDSSTRPQVQPRARRICYDAQGLDTQCFNSNEECDRERAAHGDARVRGDGVVRVGELETPE